MNEQRLRRQRRAILVGLYVLFILSGVATAVMSYLPSADLSPDFAARVDLLLAIPTSLCFMWLCTVDGKLVGKPLIQLAKLGIFLGWPIGVPLYLLWARGIRGLGLLLLHSLLMLLAALGVVLTVGCVLGKSFRV
jgi:hypothetical protein